VSQPANASSQATLSGTALITGATGFIGSHLCRRLLAQAVSLHAISRSPQKTDPRITWWKTDAADGPAMHRVFAEVKPDFIFHLASVVSGSRDLQFVQPTFASNLLSTVNVMTSAAEVGCRRVVLTGSLEEPVGDIEPVPCSPYAAAKFAGTAYARMFHALYRLPVVMLRLFMVYGPAQKDLRKLVPYVALSLLRGESPKISSGTRQVDWIYVEDVVDGILQAATAENAEGKVIDIGSGELVSVRAVVEKLVSIVNPKIVPEFGAVADRPLEQVRVADTAASRTAIGWQKSLSLDEGLRRTVDWYRTHQGEVSSSPGHGAATQA
jgi:UDP-glucose 4-epimerase